MLLCICPAYNNRKENLPGRSIKSSEGTKTKVSAACIVNYFIT